MSARVKRRMLECPCRRAEGCGLIDKLLGWQHATPIDDCDACYAKDPASADAQTYRESYARGVVTSACTHLRDYGHLPTVILTIFDRHLRHVPDLRRELARENADFLPDQIAVEVGRLAGVESEVREIIDARSPEERAHLKRPAARWLEVRHTWAMARAWAASPQRPESESTDERTHALRVLSCHGDGAEVPPCPARAAGDPSGYAHCGDCGCNKYEISRIQETPDYPVLRYLNLECPRARPGFSNHERPSA